MVLQLIVWAPTREKAIVRMQRALNDTIITGKLSGKGHLTPVTCNYLLLSEKFGICTFVFRIDVPKFK
jgi:acetyl/propionyl-CoA carboxylase alpha subunit